MKDLCSDKFYDLLYLMQEDGRPFYDYDMLKKTHMLYEIDRSISVEEIEGLFYKVCIVEDRRSHLRAQHLLKTCSYLVDEFFKEALKFKESQCVSSLASGIIALMIACNPRNLKQTTSSEKTCEHYFYDFIHYMRLCLSSEEYQKLIAISHERRPFQATLYLLIHKLIFALFTEPLEQKEMIALLRRMVSEGLQDIKGEKKGSFKEQDRAIRGYLSKYSAGALHKLSELFERGDNAKGFDPLLQHNLPEGLFFFTQNEKTIECVKIPSFCKQHYIHKAELIKEFDALMRSFNIGSKHERLLYVGVQDRTSWQDYARCTVLEEASKKEDYYKNITLFCLAKHTDFYHQSSEFADVSQAETFIGIFEEQVMGKEMCGFYISEPLQGACNKWLKPILQFVHGAFFNENLTLTREERFAFIDITYLYLIAMALEASMATLITFSDKDAVDTAAGQSALWYGLCALTSGASMSEEERGALLYLLYSPALLLRERAVNEVVASRVYGALDKIQKGYRENKKYIEKKIGALPFAKLKA